MSVDSAVALIDTSDLKTLLKISGSSEDTLLEGLINRASQLVASYCGRNFVSASRTEYYDGNGEPELILKNYPVTVLTSLHDDTERSFGSDSEIDTSEDVQLDGNAGIITLWNNEVSFIKGRGNVKVVYTAGYVKGSTVPYDLQEAVLMIAMHFYKRIYQDQRIGLQSETIGQKTMSYSERDIPTKAKTILNLYRTANSPTRSFV